MSRRTLGVGLILVGISIAAASVLADFVGLGAHPGVIGWKQILGGAVGVAVIAAGLVAALRSARRGTDPAEQAKVVGPAPQAPDAGITAPTVTHRGGLSVHTPDLPVYDSSAPRIPFVHELTELYRYRYLLWNLVLRDLKVRYKRSTLGILWAMVNPLLTMVVLLSVFVRLFRFNVEHYPIYILSGLLLWNLFARGTSVAMRSVLDNSMIRKKIYVPASTFAAASIGSALINLLFAILPLIILALATGVKPNLAWLYLPVPIIQTTLLAFGVGVIVAALAVFFADMLDIYEVLVNAYFYLTPIIYPVSILPEGLRRLEMFNPLFGFMDGFRSALIDGKFPPASDLIPPTLLALAITIAGWSLFTRLSDQFAYRA